MTLKDKIEFLNSTFRFLQKLKIGFNETKRDIITCFIYVNLVTKPLCWSKYETAWTSSLLYTKPLEKNAFLLLWTEITEVIFSIIKVALQQSREPFLRGIWQKRVMTQKKTLSMWAHREDCLKRQFWEFLANDDVLFAYVVTF